jgi:hypothetical protein
VRPWFKDPFVNPIPFKLESKVLKFGLKTVCRIVPLLILDGVRLV